MILLFLLCIKLDFLHFNGKQKKMKEKSHDIFMKSLQEFWSVIVFNLIEMEKYIWRMTKEDVNIQIYE